jgi:hypothetical protein
MTNNTDCEQIGKKLNYQYEHLLCFKQTWRSETPTASIGNNLCEGQQLHFLCYLWDKRYLKIKELSFLVRSVCVTNFPTEQAQWGTNSEIKVISLCLAIPHGTQVLLISSHVLLAYPIAVAHLSY